MLQAPATLSQAEVAAAVAAVSKCRGKPLRWSRISVVGEGAAGKTSIIRALCSEADDDPTSTIGISQRFVDLEIAAVSVEAAGGKVNIAYSRTVGIAFCLLSFVFCRLACSVALALRISKCFAVDHETPGRHPKQRR